MAFEGRCLCGGVHDQSSGPAVFMGNCSCTDCRRESGMYVACAPGWDKPAEGIMGFPGMAPAGAD
jgi:hypothetical protein